jgi:hypothetical protein
MRCRDAQAQLVSIALTVHFCQDARLLFAALALQRECRRDQNLAGVTPKLARRSRAPLSRIQPFQLLATLDDDEHSESEQAKGDFGEQIFQGVEPAPEQHGK